jgi:hypothetical protein
VFGIFTSRAMRERGRYQIQLMKTRSSSGVGQKVDLEFNLDTLRITDLGEEGQSDYDRPSPSGSKIMDSVKSTSTVSNGAPATEKEDGKVTADIQSSKLKSLLSQIKTQ